MKRLQNYKIKVLESKIENDQVFYYILVSDDNLKENTIKTRFSTLYDFHKLLEKES